MSLLISGVWSLLSFVVCSDEVKNVTGELRGKNASSALVRFVKILFILISFGVTNCVFVVSYNTSRRYNLNKGIQSFKSL
jgi:hypothetical protein